VPLSKEDMTAIVENSMFHSFSSLSHTTNEDMHISGIRTRLESELKSFTNGCFVKTSVRSPKDAAIVDKHKFESILRKEIDQAVTENEVFGSMLEYSDDDDDVEKYLMDLNNKMIILYRSAATALHVYDASTVIFLLLNSERVYMDLQRALRDGYLLNIVLREWNARSKIEWEFRAFVFGGMLTCCTQYFDLCYVKRLYDMKEVLAVKILEFFKLIKHNIPFGDTENFTIDFAYDPSNDSFCIVEINNPPPVADTGLYDWKDVKDKYIIQHGPFELRVLSQPASRDAMLEEMPPHILSAFRRILKELKKSKRQ